MPLVNKILLSPIRENIKCPKALPSFAMFGGCAGSDESGCPDIGAESQKAMYKACPSGAGMAVGV